jgi:hypothetical protein
MGILGNLFSSKPDYPAIDPASKAAGRLAMVEKELRQLAQDVKAPLEVVPAKQAAYVFIGKPPKKFGLAWIHDGKVTGLNALVEEHGLKPPQIARVLDQLREVYERHQDVQRYEAKVQEVAIVVAPSERLEEEVRHVIETIVHH